MNQMQKMFSLEGKTAVVTGGSGLYGKQISLGLCQMGAKVIIASRNVKNNEEYVKELTSQGYKAQSEYLDQGDEKSILDLVDKLSKEGNIDILVNNAVLRVGMPYDGDIALFNKSLEVNGTGIFAMCRAFGNKMAEQGFGSIINIGSYMGLLGFDDTLYRDCSFSATGAADYFFHKGGMTNLTRFMASYYGPKGVRCNILQPGGFFNNQDPIFVERYNDRTFLKRMANETDLVGAVVFLASDASAYLTGTVIPVDGGYTAK